MMYTNWKTVVSAAGSKPIPKRAVWLAASFSLLLSGCSLFPKEEPILAPPLVEPAPVQYEVAKVERGTIVKSVKGSSTITTADRRELFFKETKGLRLQSFSVKSGDQVKKGQVLAELDAAELEREIVTARYEVDKAKLELLEAQRGRPYEVEKAKLDVQEAEMNAKASETKLAAIEWEKAKLSLAALQDPKEREYEVERAKLNLQQKQVELANLESRWTETRLVSPIDGTVLFVSNVQVGDEVDAYQKLVTVGDPTKLHVLYSAPDKEALKDVQEGMKVSLTIQGGKKAQGVVVQTPRSVPSGLPEDVAELYQRSLLIFPGKLPEGVQLGTPVTIEVILEQKEQALIIPKQALHEFSGRKYVKVLDGKTKKEVDVEIGIQNNTQAEIISGLAEGQLVILE
ncbi:efflux RND transporter periplasmic adaptor subunit [Brevibacillus sp. GCM10020057]|uniref:efflux RND transporter periplasmic adaptor subunit n=1 Tax=Brevibacillus sp. GCM10020057 TaxID=3317327 RepID=UPI00362D0857